jgi:thiol-disulfide isomerase/thioredoxin
MRNPLLLAAMASALALAGCNQGAPARTAPAEENAAKLAPGAATPAAVAPINAIDRSHAGEPGPGVVWEMQGGTKQRLSDHKGMKMLVNLWATWCAPCIAEMPALDKLAGEVPVMVLPISQDMEGWQAVDKFWGKDKFKNIETGLDQPGSYAEAIKARGLPVTILYDEEGKEIWRVSGTLDWGSAEVRKAITG